MRTIVPYHRSGYHFFCLVIDFGFLVLFHANLWFQELAHERVALLMDNSKLWLKWDRLKLKRICIKLAALGFDSRWFFVHCNPFPTGLWNCRYCGLFCCFQSWTLSSRSINWSSTYQCALRIDILNLFDKQWSLFNRWFQAPKQRSYSIMNINITNIDLALWSFPICIEFTVVANVFPLR